MPQPSIGLFGRVQLRLSAAAVVIGRATRLVVDVANFNDRLVQSSRHVLTWIERQATSASNPLQSARGRLPDTILYRFSASKIRPRTCRFSQPIVPGAMYAGVPRPPAWVDPRTRLAMCRPGEVQNLDALLGDKNIRGLDRDA